MRLNDLLNAQKRGLDSPESDVGVGLVFRIEGYYFSIQLELVAQGQAHALSGFSLGF